MRIGFIGLGVMGASMTSNLQAAGYEVIVNDVRREAAAAHIARGAQWAATPAEMATQAEVVFSCLPSENAIEQVTLGEAGLIQTVRPGCALFEMSTNSLALAKRIHARFSDRGAQMLDAPISGGAGGAVKGRLAVWAGGDENTFDRFMPVLKAMADKPLYVGPIGSGLVTKLVHNCASQAMQAALAEAFVMGVKAGAEPVALWEAIRQGSVGRRRTFDGLVDEFLPGKFDPPNAALRIVYKDISIATALGRELGFPMRFANLALADLMEAMNRGWAEQDARVVMLLPQERGGVSIAVPDEKIRAVLERDPPAKSDTKRGQPD